MTSSNGNILPFVRGIHWLRVDSPHKGQRHGALVIYLISAWTNGWVNNRDAGDFRRYRAHYDFTVMSGGTLYVTLIIFINAMYSFW